MIRELYDNLTPEERKELMCAFEEGSSHYIVLPMDKFLGVNVQPSKHLHILEVAGMWVYGELIKEIKDAKLCCQNGQKVESD